MGDTDQAGKGFANLVRIMDTLRGEGGCPWDREQDEDSITDYFLEEVYEAVEAITHGKPEALAEELGDVLMEVVFLARIFEEKTAFTIEDVLEGINRKMIRRHPHVFGTKPVSDSSQVHDEWNRHKADEKERESLLDGLVRSAPALLSAFQIGARVSACGFDWDKPEDVLLKVREEMAELESAVQTGERDYVFREMGDILFALANFARHLDVNPEIALREANAKFIQRFRYIEERLRERGKRPHQTSLREMDALWEEAKAKFSRG